MAIVQSASGTSATTGCSATFAATPVQNNLLLAIHYNSDFFANTPSGWTLVAQRGDFGGYQMYRKFAGASEPTTVTVTATGAGSGSALVILELSGVSLSNPLDRTQTAGSGGSTTTSQTTGTTATTQQANEIIIGAIGAGSSTLNTTPNFTQSFTNSFTHVHTVQRSEAGVSAAVRIVTATGAYSTSTSWAGNSRAQGIIATFRYTPPASTTELVVTRGLSWQVRAPVAMSRVALHDVRESVATTRQALWGIRTGVQGERTASWAVREVAATNRQALWAARSTASGERGVAWAVRAVTGADRALSWSLRETETQTTHETDFSELATGTGVPTGFDLRINTGGTTISVAEDAGAIGGKLLRMVTTTSVFRSLEWDAPGLPDTVQMLARVRATADSGQIYGPELQLATVFDGNGVDGYQLAIDRYPSADDQLVLYRYVDDSGTDVDSAISTTNLDTWYWMLVERAGATVRGKRWTGAATDEPGGWDVEYSDGIPLPAGWVGLGCFGAGWTVEVDYWSVGTGGAAAPRPSAEPISVTITRSVSYAVRSLAGTERVASWSIRTALTALRDARWSVRGGVQIDRQTRWDVRGITTVERAAQWNVLATTGTDRGLAWALRSLVTVDRSLLWHVRALASVERGVVWDVRARLATDRTLLWQVRQPVTAIRIAEWSVREAVGIDRSILWSVEGALLELVIARGLSWNVRAALTVDRALSWHVRQAISSERDLAWSIRQAVEAERVAAWTVRQALTVDRFLLWDVEGSLVTVMVTRGLSWDLRAPVTLDRDLRWDVRHAVTVDLDVRWSIRTVTEFDRALLWAVHTELQIERDLLWNAIGQVRIDRQLLWVVEALFVPLEPGRMTLSIIPTATMTLDATPTATMTLSIRLVAAMELETV